MPCPKSWEVSKNHIKLPKFLWENTLFRQFIWMWHFVSRICDYFQFFAIMISLIWNDSILSNTHPFEATHVGGVWLPLPPTLRTLGLVRWDGVCLVCLRGVPSLRLLPPQCPSVPRELYHPHCSIPSLWLGSIRPQNRVQKYVGII